MKFQIRLGKQTYTVIIMAHLRSEKAADNEARIQLSMTALSRKEFPNVSQAAKHFKVSPATLGRRLNGGKSTAESREPVQLLAISEEKALAGCITRLTASGFPI